MASDNFTVQIGNLTNDPELRYANNGIPVTNFGQAVTTRIKDGDTWRDGDTHSSASTSGGAKPRTWPSPCAKGNRAVVIGQLETRTWSRMRATSAPSPRSTPRRSPQA
jgi:single-strand DNA-binding protein